MKIYSRRYDLPIEEKDKEIFLAYSSSLSRLDGFEINRSNSGEFLKSVHPSNIPNAYEIKNYVRLQNQVYEIAGFITTAQDAKHLTTFEDIYYGMRLDYNNTKFKLSDGSFGVIRYKTNNPNATIPKLPLTDDPPPFTGNGFTSGKNDRLGVPEWETPYNTPEDGAELWEVDSNGNETLIAIFNSNQNKFVSIP